MYAYTHSPFGQWLAVASPLVGACGHLFWFYVQTYTETLYVIGIAYLLVCMCMYSDSDSIAFFSYNVYFCFCECSLISLCREWLL